MSRRSCIEQRLELLMVPTEEIGLQTYGDVEKRKNGEVSLKALATEISSVSETECDILMIACVCRGSEVYLLDLDIKLGSCS